MQPSMRTWTGWNPPEQVGALPYRPDGDGIAVMLVTSRSTRRWILPKGWPMPGRADHDAAAIEAYEEAGVRGTADPAPIGRVRHRKTLLGRSVRITIFPLFVEEELEHWPEDERRRGWFTPQDAAAAVSNPELARLIIRFATAPVSR